MRRLAVFVLFVVFAICARAQFDTATVLGTVTDPSGAVVPHAQVALRNTATGTLATATSDDRGEFRFVDISIGPYELKVTAPGFQSASAKFELTVGAHQRVDIPLKLGKAETTVTTTANVTQLETESSERGQVVNEREIAELPLNGRQYSQLVELTAGVVPSPSELSTGYGQREGSFDINGLRSVFNNYMLDGLDNNFYGTSNQGFSNQVVQLSPDAVAEFQVVTNNMSAEFGRSGGATINVVTRYGTNEFHGRAWEFLRNTALDASGFFLPNPNAAGQIEKPALHQNQYGVTLGGPLKKDKLFFFADYQGQREKTGGAGLTTVPTATALSTCTSGGTCDLSDYIQFGEQIYKPNYLDDVTNAGRTAYPNNQIPASDLSSAAVNYFKLLPHPNVAGSGLINNYSYTGSGIYNNNQYDVRGDDRLTDKLHVFGRYTRFSGSLSGPSQLGAAGGGSIGPIAGTDAFHYNSVASGGDYVLNAKWLTDFRFAYYSIYNNTVAQNYNQPLGNNLGIPNANGSDLSLYGGLPQFNIDAPAATGANGGGNLEYGQNTNPSLEEISQYQFVNNWSHTIGNHNIKFGIDYRYGKAHLVSVESNALRSGTYFAHAARTSGVDAEGNQSPGLGFGTFLLGDATTFWRTETANVAAQSRQSRIFSYVQDQWRATQKLSINYGVRWEIYTPETVTASGAGGLLDLDTGNVNITGVGQVNSAANVQNNLSMFAPRLGVAYQIRPKTVIRAGYGLAFGQGWAGDSFGEDMTGSFPSQIQQNVQPVSGFAAVFNLTNTETLSNGTTVVQAGPPSYTFPATPSSGLYQLPNGIYQDTRTTRVRLPSVNGFNFTVQQELSPTATFQIAFVGAQAYHNMFDSSPTFNANEETLAGFEQVNPNNTTPTGGSCAGLSASIAPSSCFYTGPQRSPFYDGTAQSQLGVKFGHPYGWTQRIDYAINQATENYSALQAVLVKRISSGLSFTSNYTWSHALSHEAYEFGINPKIGRGNSYYNRRQAFIWAGDYDLPFGKGKAFGGNAAPITRYFISGFQLNTSFSWQGGLPFTACYNEIALDNDVAANDGCGPSFVSKVPGTRITLHKGKFDPIGDDVPFMPESPYPLTPPGTADNRWGPWARPAAGTWGNLGRDALWGPGIVNVDASLSKSFQLREGMSLQFILQAYNVFNHVNLNGPNSCVDCGGNAGTIQSTLGSQFDGTTLRRLQFAGRYSF